MTKAVNESEYKKAKKLVIQYENRKEKEKEQQLSDWIDSQIGKTFVYRKNCYSCPETEDDYWDTFKIIIARKDESIAIVEEWALIKKEIFEIKRHEDYLYHWEAERGGFKSGWESCSKKEFELNQKKIMRLITKKEKSS